MNTFDLFNYINLYLSLKWSHMMIGQSQQLNLLISI